MSRRQRSTSIVEHNMSISWLWHILISIHLWNNSIDYTLDKRRTRNKQQSRAICRTSVRARQMRALNRHFVVNTFCFPFTVYTHRTVRERVLMLMPLNEPAILSSCDSWWLCNIIFVCVFFWLFNVENTICNPLVSSHRFNSIYYFLLFSSVYLCRTHYSGIIGFRVHSIQSANIL